MVNRGIAVSVTAALASGSNLVGMLQFQLKQTFGSLYRLEKILTTPNASGIFSLFTVGIF